MDLAFVVAAFTLGFLASLVRLPPLVGYLVAGFALNAMGYESTPAIELLADLGVLLLLFGIGLKLSLRTLARKEVWATTSIHMAASTALFGLLFVVLATTGVPLVGDLDPGQAALIGFALSFSSTVFAVKALEERNESASLPGRLAVGILIVQDIFAVGFLVLSSGELPSIWAIPVVALVIVARPVYGWLLDRSGHGELLILLGFFLAIGVGAGLFDLVGLKPDLGALVVGLTLAGHPRAGELAGRLLSFKDILLIGFFLSIGLGGLPDLAALVVAAGALMILPLKSLGFLLLLPRFGLRARTSWHTSVTLGSYSEFGLIVIAAAIGEGLLGDRWAAAIALAVAASFALAGCKEEQVDAQAFPDLASCKAAAQSQGLVTNAECEDAFLEAQELHVESAPRYDSLQLCEQEHGEGACGNEQQVAGTGSGSIFMPLMMGYLIGNMMGGRGGYAAAQPLYRTANGSYTNAAGTAAYSGNSGRAKLNESQFRKPPTTMGKAPLTHATLASRGGFGSSGGLRGYGG